MARQRQKYPRQFKLEVLRQIEDGEKTASELYFAVGMTDNYYLEEAVYLMQEFLDSATNPPAEATIQYGFRGRHSWIGRSLINPDKQMTYAEFVDIVADFVTRDAPPGAATESWSY